jgi:hypothetical protein
MRGLPLPGELAPQRAAVMLSLIAGFQLMRQMMGLTDLARADPKSLVKVLGPIFDQLLKGTTAGEQGTRTTSESQ